MQRSEKIVIKVEFWSDAEGIEIQEIGHIEVCSRETGNYFYTLDEASHMLGGIVPLRHRGTVDRVQRRQSVWALVSDVISNSIRCRSTH